MIIKVKAPGKPNTAIDVPQSESWRFYDNCRQVQSAIIDICEVPDYREETSSGYNYAVHNGEVVEDVWLSEKPRKDDDHVMLISFIDNEGPRNLYIDTTAYLLNDDGRTIERLN